MDRDNDNSKNRGSSSKKLKTAVGPKSMGNQRGDGQSSNQASNNRGGDNKFKSERLPDVNDNIKQEEGGSSFKTDSDMDDDDAQPRRTGQGGQKSLQDDTQIRDKSMNVSMRQRREIKKL